MISFSQSAGVVTHITVLTRRSFFPFQLKSCAFTVCCWQSARSVSKTTCAMKIFCDGKAIKPAALVTYEGINSVYSKKGGELVYIEGSRTYDTLRYGKNDSKLPFKFTFTDRYNHKWEVVIDQMDDTVNMFIPCGTQMLWYGADESPTRTGSDAQTQWASVQFSWQDKTWLPPYHAGVRIQFNGYKDKTAGEWKVDTERWNNILDLAKKGTDVTGAVMEQIEKGVGIASGR